MQTDFDVAVIGGGPAGATAAQRLAEAGWRVLLLDREGRTKPCGGAIPTRCIADFAIPPDLLKARIGAARILSPSGRSVEMEIGDIGYVGMVDRDEFDPWLRARAAAAGAILRQGVFKGLAYAGDGHLALSIAWKDGGGSNDGGSNDGGSATVTAAAVVGADGANSAVRRAVFGPKKKPPYVFAYHEIVRSPKAGEAAPEAFQPDRCDVVYDGRISPDFYGWVFPHGPHTSVGCGSAVKGFDMRAAAGRLRAASGLDRVETIRTEGAPLPLKPMRRWDDGKRVLLAGDAAGVVAPSSGEGIYYAMLSGRLAAEAVAERLETGKAAALKSARRRFMRDHGRIFFVLGLLQSIWYRNDKRREQFVKMCADKDVQRLTWESYLNKRWVRRDPMAHMRVLAKDVRQLLGFSGH